MGERVEQATYKVPWALVIVLSIFLSSFGIAWLQFLPTNLYSFYNFGSILCAMDLTAAPFIVLLFTALFSKLMGRRTNMTFLTYLYVIGYACSFYVTTLNPIEFSEITASRHMNSDWSTSFVPSFMAPPAEITSQMVNGHVPIPWGEWFPSIMYHWILFILLGVFYVSIATLFRRRWIEVERVPFPHALLAYELMRRIPEEKPLMEKLGRPFLLGIILGLVFQIPVFMTSVFPWFPDIYGWKTLCASGQWYVRGGTNLAYIAGLSAFQEHPAMVAVAYIVPLSISFNSWFWHLIYIVLMQVAYSMGYYTGIENTGGCGRYWCTPSGLTDPPFKFMAVSWGGGLLGLAAITLFLSRGYIRETLKAAMDRRSNAGIEIERNEALTYRNIYLLLASSFVLLVVLFMVDGLGFVAALLVPSGYFLYWLALSLIHGMAGVTTSTPEYGNTLFRLFVWPTAPDPPTREYVLTSYYSRRMICGPEITGGCTFTGFECYRMANLTGTSNSNVLKIMLAVIVIAPIAVLLTYISLCYAYGGTALPGNGGRVQNTQFFGYTDPASWAKYPARDPLAQYILAGFIIVAGLQLLHARFVWFPFEPIGFIIATSPNSVLFGQWGSFLIAWALKMITLRVGGSKLYERAGMPLAAGFIAGYMVAVIFGGTMGVIRFFIPY
jgi:hypothetical protein